MVSFATVNRNGHPRVKPFSIVKVEEGKIYFFTGSFKELYKDLKANPNVEFSIQGKGKSIRVRGVIMFEENSEVVNKYLDENPGYRELYKERIEMLKLFYIKHGEVYIFNMKELFTKNIHFAFNLTE